jgi:hypothetical protein
VSFVIALLSAAAGAVEISLQPVPKPREEAF